MKSELEMNVKLITPDTAKDILDGMNNYRSKSQKRVSAYARIMTKGAWKLSILLFDKDGGLLDGQHRLEAVVKSGLPQMFVVIYNWPNDSVIALDNGQNRSAGQVLKSERPDAVSTNRIIAMCSGIEYISSGERGSVLLNYEKVDLYDKYGKLATEVLSRLNGPLKTGLHGIAFCKAILKYPEKTNEVFEAMRKLNELDFSEPKMQGLKLYFNYVVVKGASKGGGDVRKNSYLRCARALQAYLDGQCIDKLYCPKEDPFKLS